MIDPDYERKGIRLFRGDCINVVSRLAVDSFDAVITDPPYHLTTGKRGGTGEASLNLKHPAGRSRITTGGGFMGRKWDGGNLAQQSDTWLEFYQVLKPGGHLLAFGSTRTFHRMACAIEDAGFEIRDTLMWLYGQGFPKSYDVAQCIEKKLTTGKARRPDRNLGRLTRNRFSGDIEGRLFADTGGKIPLTTEEATQWQGWGTALKPAYEPIILARKPLEGTVAQNVLKHSTGALNIDGCRIHGEDALGGEYTVTRLKPGATLNRTGGNWRPEEGGVKYRGTLKPGRWPANVCHDGSDEVVELFPQTTSGKFTGHKNLPKTKNVYGKFEIRDEDCSYQPNSGSASRFFYCAKASAAERIVRVIEEVTIAWISGQGPCQVTLQVDTGQLPKKVTVALESEDASGWNTFLSGSNITALFQKASRYITRTKTNSTIESKTWNWLMTLLTNASTADVRLEKKANGGSLVENAESGHQSLTIILAKTVSFPGASSAASGTPLKISVSAKRHSHPTVKPLALMRWLVRLVTPPEGHILDPFGGSGTTAEAALLEGMRCTIVELEDTADIIKRLRRASR